MQLSAITVTDNHNDNSMRMMEEEKEQHIVPYAEPFSTPLFQTFGMFVGMLFGLVMHVFGMVHA